MKIPFLKQVKNIVADVKAMNSGLPANQYELGRYFELFSRQAFSASNNHYDAGKKGRLQDDWTSTNNTHSGNLKNVWKTLIARSQQAYDNNPVMRGLQAELSNNVVGTGMVPVSNVTDSNGKPAVGINKALNEGWKRFNDSFDTTGNQSFYELQDVMFNEQFKGGSMLSNQVSAPAGTFIDRQYQLMNTLRLDDSKDYSSTSFDDPQIVDTQFGINYSNLGRTVSFNIQGLKNPVAAPQMRLHFKRCQVEQLMGVPWAVPALKYIWANENLISDKLVASRIQALISFYMPGTTMSQIMAKDATSDNQMPLEPGSIITGDQGGKPEVIQADDSIGQVLEPLQKLLMHIITMTFGMSYASVTRDLTKTNMASARVNSNLDRKAYRKFQLYHANQNCVPFRDDMVFRMVLNGQVPGLNPGQYMRDPWKYNQALWQPDGFDFIDPAKEAKASIELVGKNMKTMQDHFAEKGQEWKEKFTQRKVEQDFAKELGLDEFDLVDNPEEEPDDSNRKENGGDGDEEDQD